MMLSLSVLDRRPVDSPGSCDTLTIVGEKAIPVKRWSRPGGKLRELGAEALTDRELLAILVSTGIKGKPAQQIADEILEKYGSLSGMANVPLESFLEFKGLSDVKIIRIAAAFEIARRLSREGLSHEKEE
jgi:DNA repair protein RadC